MSTQPAEFWTPEVTFADRLRLIRRGLGLSQDEFAAALEVGPSSYRQWESNRSRPRNVVSMAKRIEMYARVPAAWTLGIQQETPQPSGPEGLSEGCAPSDSNREPIGYGSGGRGGRSNVFVFPGRGPRTAPVVEPAALPLVA